MDCGSQYNFNIVYLLVLLCEVCGMFRCIFKSSVKESFFKSCKITNIPTYQYSYMGVRIGLNTPQHERQIETMEMTLLMSVAGYTLHDNEM
jgi:hypothetical protein